MKKQEDKLEEIVVYPDQVYALKELMEVMYKQKIKVYKRKEK